MRRVFRRSSNARSAGLDPRLLLALGSAELGLDEWVYREPRSADWINAWRVTEGVIMAMRDSCRRHGARFVMVTLSNGAQVHPDTSLRRANSERLGVPDLLYPDRRLQDLGENNRIPVLALAPILASMAEQNHVFFHGLGRWRGTGHWNADGLRAAGLAIASWLSGLPVRSHQPALAIGAQHHRR